MVTSINSGRDLDVHRQVYHGCFAHLCTSFWDRQKVSLKNTAFLPSLRSITGWHFSAKASTKVLRKNKHFSASGKLAL